MKQTHVIYIVGAINNRLARQVLQELDEVTQSSQPKVLLYINSSGGDFYAGFTIINALLSCAKPVVTFNMATAQSMAAAIFVCGGTRIMAPNATLMVHDISQTYDDNISCSNLRNDLNAISYDNSQYYQLLAQRAAQPKDYFQTMVQQHKGNDLYFTAHTAQVHGLATDVGLPRIEVFTKVVLNVHVDKEPFTAQPSNRRVKFH